ncbi:MAG: hypothetical protein LBN98_02610 [Prevotellaceae bacterium]|nr:hypothetical protein [Prevotellaceae bacterium]
MMPCDTSSQPAATHRRSLLRHIITACCDTSSQPAATHRRSLLRHIVAACCDTPSQPAATHRRSLGEAKPAGIQELRIGWRRQLLTLNS